MARYEIIDEPEAPSWGERIVVDPVLILFAAIIVPLVWNPPAYGRFWMPALWLLINGLALGSATLKREISALLAGGAAMFLLFRGVTWLLASGVLPYGVEDVRPYFITVLFGVFFLALYIAVFYQSQSHQLYSYIRGAQR